MASKFRSLLSQAAGFLKRRFGSPRPAAKPEKPILPYGHRGVAAGSLKERKKREEEKGAKYEKWKQGKGPHPTEEDAPYSKEEQAKWRELSTDSIEGFLHDEQILFVHSSNVAALQYFKEAGKLMVEYLNGSAYLYSGVSLPEASRFVSSASKGGEVWDTLRVRGSKTAHKKRYVRIK